MDRKKQGSINNAVIIGALIVMVILILGTIFTGQSARRATDQAVRSVSLFYLDELAGRREQVVEDTLQANIKTIKTAIGLMTEEDLSDGVHRQAYQTRMKRLFNLEKFAFVDEEGPSIPPRVCRRTSKTTTSITARSQAQTFPYASGKAATKRSSSRCLRAICRTTATR
jgi:hypothetical protein